MPDFTLDRTGLVFVSLSLAVACWTVFDTRGFFRLLSFYRKTTFTHFELMAIKVPGTIIIIGACGMILATLFRKH